MATAAPDLDALRKVVQLSAPVTLAREHTMPVLDELRPLFPEQGLRRGSTISVHGPGTRGAGAHSLAIALTVEISRSGGWVAGVGVPALGLTAALELGAALERWAFIDDPGDQVAEVVNALLSGVDLVVLGPTARIPLRHTRRLAARLRERGTSVVQLAPDPAASLSADLTIEVTASRWTGVEWGHGRLRARRVEVLTTGRGAAARPRQVAMWLPSPDGAISVIEQARFRSDPTPVAAGESDDPTGTVVELARRAG